MHHFDVYGWYTTQTLPGRATNIAPANISETTTDGELRANFTGYEWLDLLYQTPPEVLPPPPEVPQSVTMRQARLALHSAGLLTAVDAAIAAMAEPEKTATQITWEYAQTVDRGFGMVPTLAAALGMTETQIDDLFIAAAQL